MVSPLVSVLIDTYNHERYIGQAIESVLEQDFSSSDMEIIVVDDGSTDKTPDIVRKFAPRVRLLRKKNGGQASAFNAAYPELHGRIISILDGDDWFAPGKLTAVVNELESHPEAAAVGHGYYQVREAAGAMCACVPEGPRFLHLSTPEAARDALEGWRFLVVGALTVRREVMDRVIPIPQELTFCADAPIAMASMAAGARVMEPALSYYRHHSQNLHAIDPNDAARLRRKREMEERMFQVLEALLIRLGVSVDSVNALLYPPWSEAIRFNLREHGGSRFKAFRTEMRCFQTEYADPSVGYRFFKYFVVGTGALLLPPRWFYRARDLYARRGLRRFRERLCKER
jgi:glycosyltransferase involved in cell wall biosynthesis